MRIHPDKPVSDVATNSDGSNEDLFFSMGIPDSDLSDDARRAKQARADGVILLGDPIPEKTEEL